MKEIYPTKEKWPPSRALHHPDSNSQVKGHRPHSTSLQCSRCQKQFKNKVCLNRHQVYVHNKSTAHQCMKCDKYLPSASQLKDHVSFHKGIRNYHCDVFQKGFCRKNHLQHHMRIHTEEKPFICEICGRSFTQKILLGFHMRIHTGEKPYVCEICGKQFP